MQATRILLFFLVLTSTAFAQNKDAETVFRAHLDSTQKPLDDIEGIWSVSNVQEYYRYDTLYDVVKYPKAAKVAVLRKDDGKYKSFDMNGDPYEVEFVPTDVKGVYLYRNYYKETNEFSKARAVISRSGEMEYTYDFPDNYLRAHFADTYEDGTRVANQLIWTRIYPPAEKQ